MAEILNMKVKMNAQASEAGPLRCHDHSENLRICKIFIPEKIRGKNKSVLPTLGSTQSFLGTVFRF